VGGETQHGQAASAAQAAEEAAETPAEIGEAANRRLNTCSGAVGYN